MFNIWQGLTQLFFVKLVQYNILHKQFQHLTTKNAESEMEKLEH